MSTARAVDVILPVYNEHGQLGRSLELVARFAAAHPDCHFAFVEVRATLSWTAVFAERHAARMAEAARPHEITSHGVGHAGLEPGDLRRLRERLERAW